MVTIFFRIVRYGFLNFVRNGLLSTATVAVTLMALLVFLSLNLFNYITDSGLSLIKDKIDISVYFENNVPEDEILRVKRSLESLSEVKNVDYVSRDIALEVFKSKHKEDKTIEQAIAELGYNPLSASLNVKAHNPDQYANISEYLNNDSLKEMVEKVTFAQNQKVIERLSLVVGTVEQSGIALTIVLALVAGLVVYNTIRLAIYSNREEIGIMRLVGASNAFIRGPYIFTALIYGIIAALASVILMLPVAYFSDPYLNIFIPDLNFKNYFLSNLIAIIFYQLAVGLFLAVASSYFAMRKHLKV